MQVLKEEVRQRIIKSARREFKKCGFEKASMRSIASSANMTVGNLYRYYKNKEDLYGAIIGGLFGEIKTLKDRRRYSQHPAQHSQGCFREKRPTSRNRRSRGLGHYLRLEHHTAFREEQIQQPGR